MGLRGPGRGLGGLECESQCNARVWGSGVLRDLGGLGGWCGLGGVGALDGLECESPCKARIWGSGVLGGGTISRGGLGGLKCES